jgi:hypothetical protein
MKNSKFEKFLGAEEASALENNSLNGGAAEDVKVEKQQKQEKKGAEQLA